jgi:hypothetical protein
MTDSERLFNGRTLLAFAVKEILEARSVDVDELRAVIRATGDLLGALCKASSALGIEPPELPDLESWALRSGQEGDSARTPAAAVAGELAAPIGMGDERAQAGSTFGGAAGEAFDAVLLEGEVEDQDGQGGEEHQGEDGAEVGLVLADRAIDAGGDGGALARVNGGTAVEVPVTGTSFATPATTSITVHLNAGANSIKFLNTSAFAPDLDKISIS